jgi:hypothetical protein
MGTVEQHTGFPALNETLYLYDNKVNQIKWNEMVGTCSTIGRNEKNACSILVAKHERKVPLGRPR